MHGLAPVSGFKRWRGGDGAMESTRSWSLRALFEGFEFFVQRFGNAAGAEAVGVQGRDLHLRVQQQPAVAADVLRDHQARTPALAQRSEEQTSELQSLMRISYAVFCLKNKNKSQR